MPDTAARVGRLGGVCAFVASLFVSGCGLSLEYFPRQASEVDAGAPSDASLVDGGAPLDAPPLGLPDAPAPLFDAPAPPFDAPPPPVDAPLVSLDAPMDATVRTPDAGFFPDVSVELIDASPARDGSTDAGPSPRLRPIFPRSGSRITGATPSLRWKVVAGEPAEIASYEVHLCVDRACTSPVTGSPYLATIAELTLPPDLLLPNHTYFWKVVGRNGAGVANTDFTPPWQFHVVSTGISSVHSFGIRPDLDGDGFEDVVVAYDAPIGGGGSSVGAFFVRYHTGREDFLGASIMHPHFAHTIAAGDINGDGFVDLAAAAIDGGTGVPAAVYVYKGSVDGLLSPPTVLLAGSLVAVDAASFGASMVTVGDRDEDSYADIAIGIPGAGAGRVLVLYGSPLGLERPELLGPPGGVVGVARFGASMASLGNLDGDPRDDLLVGMPGHTSGLVVLHRGGMPALPIDIVGGPTGETMAHVGPSAGPGTRVAISRTDAGVTRFQILSIQGSGAVSEPWSRVGIDGLGASISGGIDADGDGTLEVLAGAPSRDTGRGAAVSYTQTGGMAFAEASCEISTAAPLREIGRAVAGLIQHEGHRPRLLAAAIATPPAVFLCTWSDASSRWVVSERITGPSGALNFGRALIP